MLSCCPYRLKEVADLELEAVAVSRQRLRRRCEEAVSVSVAQRCTSLMLAETCCVPLAACCTFREISCVAAPCSSTAAAITVEISDSFSIVPEISWTAPTESCVAASMPETC